MNMTLSPAALCAALETASGQNIGETQLCAAAGTPTPDAASGSPQTSNDAPCQVTHWSSGHIPLEPYDPAPQAEIVDKIVSLHRRRQAAIRAKTKIILMLKAEVRSLMCSDADFEEDKTTDRVTAFGKKPRKLTKSAQKRVDDAIKLALDEIEAGTPESEVACVINSFVKSQELFDDQCDGYAKQMVKLVKQLPVYGWVKSVPGFGDVSFATIVGECGDIGTYKSVSAVWKRLGLAVINGNRQGAPGEGATSQDWIDHGYNRQRRSTSWNARKQVIGDMGLWRPNFGSNLGECTYYQRVYAERARLEAMKLDMPVACKVNAKGIEKESYKEKVANRAHRYVEKRLLQHLYIEWRRAA